MIRQVARTVWDNAMAGDPELAKAIYADYGKILRKEVPQVVLDCFAQTWGKFDIYHAADFRTIFRFFELGKIYTTAIRISGSPFPDKEISENNRILKDIPGFEAEFWGEKDDHDGYIKPLFSGCTMANHICKDKDCNTLDINGEEILLAAGKMFPLEVGYYDPNRAYHTLITEGRLARWPYGYEEIHLFALDGELLKQIHQKK